ncbi:MAG: hypothetical protein KAJ19_24955, partial [Gammaproteobacteria bacterium]|nr:hypothetical protein [Gammaproteobacteria bacterium]
MKTFIRIIVVILIALLAIIAFWPLELDKGQAFLIMILAFSLAATVIWLSLYLGFGIKINKVLAELLYILIIPFILILRFIWEKARTLWHKKPKPKKRDPWYLGSIFDVLKLRLKPLEIVLGTHWGKPIRIRLDKYHTMVGGSTDQGKTVLLNSIIAQLILSEQPIDIWIFDLKGAKEDAMLLWSPIIAKYINDIEPAIEALTELLELMRTRSRDGWERELVVFIDELVELTSDMVPEYRRHTINLVSTLARMGRSGGIRIIAATQHPRYSDVPKIIAHNLMRKICLGVAAESQAQVILEVPGQIPVGLPEKQGDFVLREGKRFRIGRTIIVTRDDIAEIVNRVVDSDDDERLRILRRVTTGLQPGDRIRGLNATAESLSMDSEILK